jgi:hypothetical protein
LEEHIMRAHAILIAALLATPALAQTAPQTTAPSENPDAPRAPLPTDRGYDKPSARTEAINAASRPAVRETNEAVRTATADQPVLSVAPADQARYDADMAEYRAALREHDARMADDAAYSARQERAYADAMTAWRIQSNDCKRGITAACRAPTPRPADFW